jgi:hypothetical protein
LLSDKTQKPGKASLFAETAAKVLSWTCAEPSGEATHWIGRAVARSCGGALRLVQRFWETSWVQLHQIRSFTRPKNPAFAEKVEHIISLDIDPPTRAVVLPKDETSQTQDLGRTHPRMSMRRGKRGTTTHHHERYGTTAPSATVNVLEGKVVGRCMQHNRHQEFRKCFNAVQGSVQTSNVIPS